jgi:hypothetical protein
MSAKLVYLIKFVGDMSKAAAFHRDVLGLKLRFGSPFWSEFDTGATTLALHPASAKNPAGTCQLGFRVADLKGMYAEREKLGVGFSAEPSMQRGVLMGKFLDTDGAENSISGEAAA